MFSVFLALLSETTDQEQFERIYLSYRKQMFIVARGILQNDADAEDAVHDVFFRIASGSWETVCRIENETDLRNYLLKAVRNRALSLLSRSAKKDVALDDPAQENVDRTEDETFALVCANMEETRLLRAIEKLPESYRDVLYYRFVLQFSAVETARAMELSVAAARKRIQRGKQKLLELLEEE